MFFNEAIPIPHLYPMKKKSIRFIFGCSYVLSIGNKTITYYYIFYLLVQLMAINVQKNRAKGANIHHNSMQFRAIFVQFWAVFVPFSCIFEPFFAPKTRICAYL